MFYADANMLICLKPIGPGNEEALCLAVTPGCAERMRGCCRLLNCCFYSGLCDLLCRVFQHAGKLVQSSCFQQEVQLLRSSNLFSRVQCEKSIPPPPFFFDASAFYTWIDRTTCRMKYVQNMSSFLINWPPVAIPQRAEERRSQTAKIQ